MSAADVLWPPGTVVHADGTIDAQPCRRCKRDTLSIVEYAVDGDVLAADFVCRDCQTEDARGLAELRAVFEGYLAAGMSRETANRVMVAWHVRAPKEYSDV